jgi:hypothetical protein
MLWCGYDRKTRENIRLGWLVLKAVLYLSPRYAGATIAVYFIPTPVLRVGSYWMKDARDLRKKRERSYFLIDMAGSSVPSHRMSRSPRQMDRRLTR